MTTQVTFTVKAPKDEISKLLEDTSYLEDEDIVENSNGTTSITCHDPDRFYWAHYVRDNLKERYPNSFDGPEDW